MQWLQVLRFYFPPFGQLSDHQFGVGVNHGRGAVLEAGKERNERKVLCLIRSPRIAEIEPLDSFPVAERAIGYSGPSTSIMEKTAAVRPIFSGSAISVS